MKHLLKLLDLEGCDIIEILNLADKLKYELKHGIEHKHLQGKTLGMIFQKASTRTRVSFETGIYQLGGQGLFLNGNDLQLGRGEPICDTARVLSRYLEGIMIRTFAQSDVEQLAEFGSIPIINGLTDYAHPCQVLADLMTVRECKGRLDGLTMAFIGDGNNMANSLIVGALKVGMTFHMACPKGYEPDKTVLDYAAKFGDRFMITADPREAAAGSDVVVTDVWASMGQESEKAKREIAFAGYQINAELMKLTNNESIVLHCLPAHRGEEISAEIMDNYASVIFEEAENRLHAQKAVMTLLMK